MTAPAHRRRSFTLIEMLIVMTIMAIIATLIYGAMEMAQRSAREAKTKATIAKLHRIIMTKWESYRTRRVPLDPATYAKSSGFYTAYLAYLQGGTPTTSVNKDLARLKLNALRDLMRMELPDRWSDVVYNPSSPSATDSSTTGTNSPVLVNKSGVGLGQPALSQRYAAKFTSAANTVGIAASSPIWQYPGAKCLYMIVMSDPDDAAQFQADEYGDYTGDRLPVFLDGWHRPIQFLRWPAGFIPANNADSNLQSGNATTDPDPFDPMKVFGEYAIYPLIYSCGANPQRDSSGQFRSDINLGKTGSGSAVYSYSLTGSGDLNPYAADGAGFLIGQPLAPNGTGTPQHLQNIHNQRLEVR